MRILLADDHTLFRAGIRSLLDRVGEVQIVAETGDGRHALELIEKHRPDIALLDITMPGLNGLEVALKAVSRGDSYLSPAISKTVETHRAQIMDRLDIHDIPGLVRFAIRAGLVSPDA